MRYVLIEDKTGNEITISLADLEKAFLKDKTLSEWKIMTWNFEPKPAQILGCHSDQSKFCKHCLKDMEERIWKVFCELTGRDGTSYNPDRAILNYIYYVAGDEQGEDGQKFLYKLWEQNIVYRLDHTPIFNAKATKTKLGFTGVFWFDAHTKKEHTGNHGKSKPCYDQSSPDYVLRVE